MTRGHNVWGEGHIPKYGGSVIKYDREFIKYDRGGHTFSDQGRGSGKKNKLNSRRLATLNRFLLQKLSPHSTKPSLQTIAHCNVT